MSRVGFNEHLAKLLHELGPALVLYARTWAGRDEAEDVVQRVCVKLLSSGRVPREPRAWLFRCVRNESLSFRRSLQRRLKRERAVASDETVFEKTAGDCLDAEAAQAALNELTDRQREVVVLRIWSGMTLAEVSAVTGMAVSTVHDQYTAAMAAMKKRMEPKTGVENG